MQQAHKQEWLELPGKAQRWLLELLAQEEAQASQRLRVAETSEEVFRWQGAVRCLHSITDSLRRAGLTTEESEHGV